MRTSARAVGAIVIFGAAGVSALGAASAAQAVTRSAAVTRYAVGSTNVRSGPAATTSIAGSLAKGTAVTGLQQANGWIKIVTPAKYADKYVSGAVLAARVPPTPIVFSGWVAADKGVSVNVRSAPRFTAPVTAKYAGGAR